MAFFEGSIYSDALGISTSICVSLPYDTNNKSDGKPPVLYLLHGLFDNHTAWVRNTNVDMLAKKYGFAVVMPNAGKSYYTDMKYGPKYFTYISEELPELCRRMFNVSEKREKTFVAGISMGGYGALKLGLRRPDIFGGCAGISAAADIKPRAADYKNRPEMRAVFGETGVAPEDDDLFLLAEKQRGTKCKILMHCGLSDTKLNENWELYKALLKNGFDVEYIESEGAHDWTYWERILPQVMEYFALRGVNL
ncbi:esterase [[Clostridium] cellulosi]|uniref:Esterase n=1 Tax=[Clostridium] cellulosi TaxID=29343 RepID=A0A078KRM8_9FIRM|nr:MAG: esterase [[Clostridium] cellulosi]CDZ25043.1 esterase [[Clostridium] cellulosi]